MTLHGLDLNATRARSVRGPLGDYPVVELLEPPRAELPLAVSLEGKQPVPGSPALRLCRRAPQHAWTNFLPRLGEPAAPGRQWLDGRRRFDADRALTLVCQHIVRVCKSVCGVTMAVPAYLADVQVARLLTLADQAGLPVLGSVAAPLAAALAAHAEQSWFGSCLVLDVDDQALTLAPVVAVDGQARLLDVRSLPQLSLRVWRERLLNALADGYVFDSRWDPRESPAAEQALFDQLDEVIDAAAMGRVTKVTVQTAQRFQNLVLHGQDPVAFCTALRRQCLAQVGMLFAGPWPHGSAPGAILVTYAASRLPGLVAGLQECMPLWSPQAAGRRKPVTAVEDFGSNLLDEGGEEPGSVVVLAADATARGAHAVGAYYQRGDMAAGHLNNAAPLPLPQPVEAGPARLHFQGQDYLLGTGSFSLGRQPGVDLLFDGELWPGVAARHCEIVYDHRTHMLCDRSPRGTLVNDRPATQAVPLRPGDWIRLGPDGPVLRYLGQSVDLRPTA
jgi:hypothetical protein